VNESLYNDIATQDFTGDLLQLKEKKPASDILRGISKSRKHGHGLRCNDWHLQVGEIDDLVDLVEGLLSWCKLTLGVCRRPYGIDLFDLIVAFRTQNETRARSFAMDGLRPIELYEEDLPRRMLAQLSRALPETPSTLYVSAGFFSWGDAAHESLLVRP
jgi:hypothetical protein